MLVVVVVAAVAVVVVVAVVVMALVVVVVVVAAAAAAVVVRVERVSHNHGKASMMASCCWPVQQCFEQELLGMHQATD